LQRAPSTPGSAVLTCHTCGARFDVRRAGSDLQEPGRHLEPVPLLERDGVVEVAVRTPVPV
jgi:nitrite reductase/ring-hydroxylating ferredoxin subunit